VARPDPDISLAVEASRCNPARDSSGIQCEWLLRSAGWCCAAHKGRTPGPSRLDRLQDMLKEMLQPNLDLSQFLGNDSNSQW